MGMMKDFKEFAMKGNVMDLAVGVIIGAAFGKIVTSLVEDLIMPVVNRLIPGGNWQTMTFHGIKIGHFAGSVFDFIIVAIAIFMIVKALNNMQKEEATAPAAPAEPSASEKLLMEIRDSLKK